MQLPGIEVPTDAPSYIQVFTYIGLVLGGILMAWVGRGAVSSGRKAAESPDVEIAGALIDSKIAKEWIASNQKNTEALDRLNDNVDEMRQEMRELTREIVRNGAT